VPKKTLPTSIRKEVVDLAIAALRSKKERLERTKNVHAPQDREELWHYVRDTFGVEISRHVHPECVDKGHVAPFDAFAESYFGEVENSLWLGSRGMSGKTFLSALLSITEQVTLGAEVSFLGGSLEQSTRGHEYTQMFWDKPGAPRHLLLGDPTARMTRLANGGIERVLAASSKSVRGGHPQRLRPDEVDEMDVEILDAAFGQPLSKNGIRSQITMTSTHHYPNGAVTEILRRIESGDFDCVVRRWCYKENMRRQLPDGTWIGWLDADEINRAKRRVTKRMFEIEYDLMEPSIEGRAIDGDALRRMWDKEYGTYEGRDGEYIEIPCCSRYNAYFGPCKTHAYATGIDWGQNDWTVLVTYRVDTEPMWLVGWQRMRKQPWPTMIRVAKARLNRFPGQACHDATGMGGNILRDLLGIKAEPITLQGNLRAAIFNNYIVSVENNEMVGAHVESAWYDHYYVTRDDLFNHSKQSHPPDSIVAGALSRWAARYASSTGGISIGNLSGSSRYTGLS